VVPLYPSITPLPSPWPALAPRAAKPNAVAVAAFHVARQRIVFATEGMTATLYFSICEMVARTSAAWMRSWPTSTPPTIRPIITSTIDNSIRGEALFCREWRCCGRIPRVIFIQFVIRHIVHSVPVKWVIVCCLKVNKPVESIGFYFLLLLIATCNAFECQFLSYIT